MANYYYAERRMDLITPNTRFGDATIFHLTLVSVDNLQCERRIGRQIRVYAEVQLDGGAITRTDTYVAGGPDPTWNFTVHYPVADVTGGNLVVRLYYKRSVGHTSIGEVNIDVGRLFDGWRDSRQNTATFLLPNGGLNIAYRFA